MVNDGLSGVAVMVEIAEEMLKKKDKRNYTYKFIVLPETIGSISYLSQNEAIIPTLKYGLFLEMLAMRTFMHSEDQTRQYTFRSNRKICHAKKSGRFPGRCLQNDCGKR